MPGPTKDWEISLAQPSDSGVAELLARHFELMRSQSPPESCHVLPADMLDHDDIDLFALRENRLVLAVGALRRCDDWGELKSMHTAKEARGRGAARALVRHLIIEARDASVQRLYLETGSGPDHAAARHLYETAGFEACAPFGGYTEDPLSHFMSRNL